MLRHNLPHILSMEHKTCCLIKKVLTALLILGDNTSDIVKKTYLCNRKNRSYRLDWDTHQLKIENREDFLC